MESNPRWLFLGTRMVDGRHGNLVGSLDLDSLKRFTDRVAAYQPGARLLITVELEPRVRTLDQNAFWHGFLVRPLADRLGWTHQAMHDHLKKIILGGQSTTKLTPSQFSEAIEEARAWAQTEHGIRLPEPNEVESAAVPR